MSKEVFGSCFRLAVEYVETRPNKADFIIAHGILTTPSGRRVVHAWVEMSFHLGGNIFDPSVKVLYTRSFFLNGYKAAQVRRYTYKMAIELCEQSDTYGPWHFPLLRHMDEEKIPPKSDSPKARQWLKEVYRKHGYKPVFL